MKLTYILGGLLFLAAAAVKSAPLAEGSDFGGARNLPINDPGAARLSPGVSDCYRASLQPGGKQCAEPALAAADASASDRVAAYLARAVFDIEMDKAQQALPEVDAALSVDADNVGARHLAARICLTIGDVDRAEREISIARRLAPNDPAIGTTYAAILIARQANREAVGVYDDIIRRHPNYLFARDQRAVLFTYLGECCARGNYSVALADLDYLIRHAAPNAELLARRAGVLAAVGKPADAVDDLTAAMRIGPDGELLKTSRAEYYARLGRDDLAVKDYDAVLAEASPGEPLYHFMPEQWTKLLVGRAFSLVRLNRLDDAANDVVKAIAVGGKPAILRAQVMLRRHGFPDVPINGQDSPKLRQALSACFGLMSCYQPVMHAI
ncbi:MAG: hypothetical protein GC182_06185 [Rhodopseudomonas sp.]|nr:hypothetical protein [Rhodopseudomonas sp.]